MKTSSGMKFLVIAEGASLTLSLILKTMLINILALTYERDLQKMIDELQLFDREENIWKTQGSITNTAGNLALHIIGGLNHYFGAILAKTGYERNRENEFSQKGVSRNELVSQIEILIPLVTQTIGSITPTALEADFPIPFDGAKNSTTYVLLRLALHLNYHLGQVNYLRRSLEP